MPSSLKKRRWRRYPVDLPVRIIVLNGALPTVVPGRGTELSEGGMALYAGVNLKPGDLMQVEFLTPYHSQVTGMIRNRSGYYFGLEFLTPIDVAPKSDVESMSDAELDNLITAHQQHRSR